MLEKLPKWLQATVSVLKEAGSEFSRDRGSRMAAAIAYRTVFALAPLLIIGVWVLGLLTGDASAERTLLDSVGSVAGSEVRDVIANLLDAARDEANTAAIAGFAALFWTGSSLFLELQQDLNDIFDAPQDRVSGIMGTLRKRAIGFIGVLFIGIALIGLWLANVVWRFLGGLLPASWDEVHTGVGILTPFISFVLFPFLFGLILQTMTAVRLSWRVAWAGGLVTSLVFVTAAYGAGVFFEMTANGDGGPSALGFAGSIAVILFLAFLLAAVFLFGAEITRVYAHRIGERKMGDEPTHQIVVDAPPSQVPSAAVFAFLGGLLVGWWRRRS